MRELLPFIISGIVSGSIYGLAASGLVLTYKTSGILNFGHGAIATTAAYCYYWLHVTHGADWKIAVFVSVFVLGPILGYVMQVIGKPLARQRIAWKIVGTIGLILIVQSLGTIKYGTDALQVDSFLPGSSNHVNVFGDNVGYDDITIITISVIAVLLLFAFFRWSRTGISMRAVVDDSDLVDMMGTNAVRVRRLSWVIGAVFAAMSGVLIVPSLGLDPIALTLLVVQAFGAAAFGLFSNIPMTFAGGLVIGVAASVPVKYVVSHPSLSGIPQSVPFILLFLILLVIPRRKLVRRVVDESRARPPWKGSSLQRALGSLIVIVGLAIVPLVVGSHLSYWTLALTQIIMFLSLGLLIRTAGQVSLCHVAFAAIGAVAFSQFDLNLHMPWLIAVLLGALVAVPVGAIVAIPAIRLSGVFLALATLGFGIMVEQLFYPTSFMFTITSSVGREMPRPSFATGDKPYYYVVLAFVIVSAAVIAGISAGRLGRMLRGLGEAPVAVATLGLNLNVTRVLVFCVSAFFAGLAGILYGGLVHFASTADSHYASITSLILVATLALVPMRDPWYAVIAGLTSVIPAYIPGADTTYWMNLIFGLSAVLVAMQGGPQSMPAAIRKMLGRNRRPSVAPELTAEEPRRSRENRSGGGLSVEDLSVQFGGLVAVSNLNIEAPMGRITGLIGPNGAGKTTTFNACSGIERPTTGRVTLNGHDVSHLRPDQRARRGLGRTFQLPELGDSLSVFENVALGWEAGRAGANALRQVVASPAERHERESATWHALAQCGITDLADTQAGIVTTGQRRLIELARALAGDFDVLLLDEPSAGLDREETDRFGDLLSAVVQERGCGILLVEHDMSLVMRICQHIYVLDYGEEIFAGTPAEVAASVEVQTAYLGVAEVLTEKVPAKAVQ